jgi:methyl-accepting chemotaxis protein
MTTGPRIATAANLTTQTDTIAIALRNMMLNPDAADRERQQQVIAKARQDTEDNLQTLDRLLTTPPDREMLRKVQELRARYFAGLEELRPLILADQNNEAREYLAARLRPVLGQSTKPPSARWWSPKRTPSMTTPKMLR